MRTSIYSLALILFSATQTLPALAYEVPAGIPATSTIPQEVIGAVKSPAPKPVGLSSCFDHYQFGSVQANVSPSLASTAPGATIAFAGSITNNNPYPIPDAVVYAKIFRSRGGQKNVNGNDDVAFFAASKRVTLKAHESKPLTFTWQVPADAEPGGYLLATDVVSSDRFELSGLVFTDDVVGSLSNFSVTGNGKGAVRFDKDSVMVSDQHFYFAALPPAIPQGAGAVPVKAKVSNSTSAPFEGTITWNVYFWDSVGNGHLLDTQKQELKVHPNSSSDVGVTVTDKAHPIYYVLGTFKTADGSESNIGIRFSRAGINEPRFNFVTVDQGIAVACIHSTGAAASPDGHVDITVVGNTWWQKLLSVVGIGTLAHARYDGPIPGEIYALAVPLKHIGSSYSITANLSQGEKHIDTVVLNYSCTDLGTSCKGSTIISIALALIALAVVVGGFMIRRKRKPTEHTYPSV